MEYSVEELFEQLNQITEKMEQQDISLEESFQLYREGVNLVKTCHEKLDKVEKEMIILSEEDQ